MQTHEDFDFDRLRERARRMTVEGVNQITAGKPGEEYQSGWNAANGVAVRELPADEQGVLRISIGGGIQKVDVNYCTFRGDRVACIHLLEMALHALRDVPRDARPGDLLRELGGEA